MVRITKAVVRKELEDMETPVDQYLVDEQVYSNSKIIRIPGEKKNSYEYFCTNCERFFVPEKKKNKLHEKCRCTQCRKEQEIFGIHNKIDDIHETYSRAYTNERGELIITLRYIWLRFKRDWRKPQYEELLNDDVIRINVDKKVFIQRYLNTCMYNICPSVFQSNWRDGKRIFDAFSYTPEIDQEDFELKGKYKYAMIKEFIGQDYKNTNIFRYIDTYNIAPIIEMLIKTNKWELVYQMMQVSKEGLKAFCESLTRQDKKWIMKQNSNLSMSEIRIHQYTGVNDISEVRKFDRAGFDHWESRNVNNKDFYKIRNYLLEQGKDLRYYMDYIRMCTDYDIIPDRFPKSLEQAHDKTLETIENLKNEEKDILIKKRAEILQVYKYENEYLIRPVESTFELVQESNELSHCVKTYSGQVAGGKTNIFFIRDVNEPNKPLYTLELDTDNNRVIQCRAKKNGVPNDDAKEFVNTWCKKFNFVSCFEEVTHA